LAIIDKPIKIDDLGFGDIEIDALIGISRWLYFEADTDVLRNKFPWSRRNGQGQWQVACAPEE